MFFSNRCWYKNHEKCNKCVGKKTKKNVSRLSRRPHNKSKTIPTIKSKTSGKRTIMEKYLKSWLKEGYASVKTPMSICSVIITDSSLKLMKTGKGSLVTVVYTLCRNTTVITYHNLHFGEGHLCSAKTTLNWKRHIRVEVVSDISTHLNECEC